MDSANVPEPAVVYPEAEFEKVLVDLVRGSLSSGFGAVMVPKFGLDLAVLLSRGLASTVLFIEAKSYGAQRLGGVGFGNSRGEGPQVELLMAAERDLDLIDQHTRWAFVDATEPFGSARYALITSSQARACAMGVVARGKQNNFRMSALRPHLVSWNRFCGLLRSFVSVASI